MATALDPTSPACPQCSRHICAGCSKRSLSAKELEDIQRRREYKILGGNWERSAVDRLYEDFDRLMAEVVRNRLQIKAIVANMRDDRLTFGAHGKTLLVRQQEVLALADRLEAILTGDK